MDTILHMFYRGVEHVIGRLSGPLNFRLFVMPTVVAVLAIRAGLRDAREGQPAYLQHIFRSGVKDIGKIFIVAVVLDTAYQLFVLRAFYIVQVLFVAVTCAIVPYVLVRGPVTRLARLFYQRKKEEPTKASAARVTSDPLRRG